MFRTQLKIKFYGYAPERFMNLCKHKELCLRNIEATEHGYTCFISVKDFRNLKPIAKKTHIRVRILKRYGYRFTIFRYKKRKMFVLGLYFAFIFIYLMATRLWSIELNGNNRITYDVMKDYLKEQDISQGTPLKNISCEILCTNIRNDFPEIIWVSTSLNGTKLTIDVKERVQVSRKENKRVPSDIISVVNGKIKSIITRKGTPLVHEGDDIHMGDILVSGKIPVMNDAGEVIREENVCAEADIIVNYQIPYEDICDNNYQKKEYFKTTKYNIEINIFSRFLNIDFSKKSGRQEVLGDLIEVGPLQILIKRSKEYIMKDCVYTINQQEDILNNKYTYYAKELEQEGITITAVSLKYSQKSSGLVYSGVLEVEQLIVDLYE